MNNFVFLLGGGGVNKIFYRSTRNLGNSDIGRNHSDFTSFVKCTKFQKRNLNPPFPPHPKNNNITITMFLINTIFDERISLQMKIEQFVQDFT